jgi:hypothetical protein
VKRCQRCGQELDESQFRLGRLRKDGTRRNYNTCKPCERKTDIIYEKKRRYEKAIKSEQKNINKTVCKKCGGNKDVVQMKDRQVLRCRKCHKEAMIKSRKIRYDKIRVFVICSCCGQKVRKDDTLANNKGCIKCKGKS